MLAPRSGLGALVHVAAQSIVVDVDRTGAVRPGDLAEFVLEEHEVHGAEHALVDDETRL